MKILLIGDKGQVGREVQELAETRNIPVVGFDIDNLDITDKQQVNSAFAKCSDFNMVINAAAYTAVDQAEDEPDKAYAVNCDGVENLASASCKYNIPLLHISTDFVFSGEKGSPYEEADLVAPLGVYGKSKLAGERVLVNFWQKHVILRISWVFGKYGNNFVKTILHLANVRESFGVVGDQFGCPTPAKDVARVLLGIAEQIYSGQERFGIYHYCGKPSVSWYEFANHIIELSRYKYKLKLQNLQKITTEEYPTKAVRPHYSVFCAQKILEDYGIEQHEWVNYLQKVIQEIEL